jgi:hypothetical protein
MNRSRIMLLMCCALLPMTTGCLSRAIKEGVGAARGAKAAYSQTVAVRPGSLEKYTNYTVGPVTDGFGGKAPREVLRGLPRQLKIKMAEKGIPNSHANSGVLIATKIIYAENASLVGQAFGPFEEVLADVTLTDMQSGKQLGRAICIGRSGTTVNDGWPKKTDALARAILEWIQMGRGIDEKDKGEE